MPTTFDQVYSGTSSSYGNNSVGYNILVYIPWDIMYAGIAVPTILGNTLILLCLIRFRDIKCSIHILIGNLAVSDLVVGAVLLPYCIILDLFNLNSEKYFCLTKASLMVFSLGGSCYGLLLVSIDRFSAICFPFQHRSRFNSRKIFIMLTIGWTYVSLFAFLPLSGWNFYDQNLPYNCQTDRVLTPIYQKILNVNFYFTIGINITLYIIVVRVAINKAKKIYTDENYIYDFRSSMRELHKVKTMAIIQGLFVICWFPYIMLSTATMFSDNLELHKVQFWSLVPGIMNSSFNWIIYGYRNKQLGKQMRLYIKCSCLKRP